MPPLRCPPDTYIEFSARKFSFTRYICSKFSDKPHYQEKSSAAGFVVPPPPVSCASDKSIEFSARKFSFTKYSCLEFIRENNLSGEKHGRFLCRAISASIMSSSYINRTFSQEILVQEIYQVKISRITTSSGEHISGLYRCATFSCFMYS